MLLPKGIPSHDTFNRIFRYLKPKEFENRLKKWSKEIIEDLVIYQINIDGKVLRGRIERRTTYVCKDLQFLDELDKWPDCQRVIMVECERSYKNEPEKISRAVRFYVSSKEQNASYLATCTRNHWSIENQLHWYLDVVFHEDLQRVHKDNGAENMATLRKMALQLLLKNKGNASLKKVRKRAGCNDEFLLEVLKSIF